MSEKREDYKWRLQAQVECLANARDSIVRSMHYANRLLFPIGSRVEITLKKGARLSNEKTRVTGTVHTRKPAPNGDMVLEVKLDDEQVVAGRISDELEAVPL